MNKRFICKKCKCRIITADKVPKNKICDWCLEENADVVFVDRKGRKWTKGNLEELVASLESFRDFLRVLEHYF